MNGCGKWFRVEQLKAFGTILNTRFLIECTPEHLCPSCMAKLETANAKLRTKLAQLCHWRKPAGDSCTHPQNESQMCSLDGCPELLLDEEGEGHGCTRKS